MRIWIQFRSLFGTVHGPHYGGVGGASYCLTELASLTWSFRVILANPDCESLVAMFAEGEWVVDVTRSSGGGGVN